jgi:hypothetical protein
MNNDGDELAPLPATATGSLVIGRQPIGDPPPDDSGPPDDDDDDDDEDDE